MRVIDGHQHWRIDTEKLKDRQERGCYRPLVRRRSVSGQQQDPFQRRPLDGRQIRQHRGTEGVEQVGYRGVGVTRFGKRSSRRQDTKAFGGSGLGNVPQECRFAYSGFALDHHPSWSGQGAGQKVPRCMGLPLPHQQSPS